MSFPNFENKYPKSLVKPGKSGIRQYVEIIYLGLVFDNHNGVRTAFSSFSKFLRFWLKNGLKMVKNDRVRSKLTIFAQK